MEIKKQLTIFVVFLAVVAAMSTIIEAQRGGGHGGGMGGGHHWSVNAGSDNNNVGDNNNAGYVEVYVSTDKRMYVLGEPIEITVTAYNPTEYAVGVDWSGCNYNHEYVIDGYITRYDFVDEHGTIIGGSGGDCGGGGTEVFQPHEIRTQTFIRDAGTINGDEYVPLPVGRHSVVGAVGVVGYTDYPYESRPISIQVTDPNNSGM